MQDRQDVMTDKSLYLSTLIQCSQRTVIYTGSGVSMDHTQGRTTNATPSLGHYVLASLLRLGLADSWVQLCHDGLAQKAGCGQEKVMEVTGSWYDPSNPVIKKGVGFVRPEIKVSKR